MAKNRTYNSRLCKHILRVTFLPNWLLRRQYVLESIGQLFGFRLGLLNR